MSMYDDLLVQARHLATKERKRPKQASLRRAISSAYYALFHLLISEATQRLISGKEKEPLRLLLRRAFEHGEMKDAAKSFLGTTIASVTQVLGTSSGSSSLRKVARAFVDLQEARHQADYDWSRTFTRQETLELVDLAEDAFETWEQIRKRLGSDTFLICLLTYKRIRGR